MCQEEQEIESESEQNIPVDEPSTFATSNWEPLPHYEQVLVVDNILSGLLGKPDTYSYYLNCITKSH